MHIVYEQCRCRNNVQAIYILSAQYTVAIAAIYAIWSLPSLQILQVGLDAINLPLGHCAILRHIHFACARSFIERFCHDNNIREKKNSKTMTPKNIDGIKAYLKNVEGWQQPYCILHVATVALLCTQYVYCLRIVPISKLCIHNMHIACNSHTECDNTNTNSLGD